MYTDLKNIDDTISTLKDSIKDVDEFQTTLSDFEFKYDLESKEPYLSYGSKEYYFDIENTFGLEQFCNWLKIKQYKFFITLSFDLQEKIVKEQLEKINPKRNKVLLKVRYGKEKNYIRAVLKQSYETTFNYDILEQCTKNFDKTLIKSFLCKGYALDEPSIQLSFIFSDELDIDQEKFNLGIEILASELGDNNLEFYGFVYSERTNLFYRIPFNYSPYFQSKYKQSEDLESEFESLYEYLIKSKSKIKDILKEALKTTLIKDEHYLELFTKIELEKGIPSTTLNDLKIAVLGNKSSFKTMFDLANHISSLSEDVRPSDKENYFWKGKIFSKVGKLRSSSGYLLGLDQLTKD